MIRFVEIITVALLICCMTLAAALSSRNYFDVVAEWSNVDYVFASSIFRRELIHSGEFIPNNVIVLDTDAHGQGVNRRIFVTTPRLMKGVPATLSILAGTDLNSSPKLLPFPDWGANRLGGCNALVSVFRVSIDSCGRLWAIDSGVVDVFGEHRHVCPPKIVVFNLEENRLDTIYQIPSSVTEPTSLLITIAVDVRGRDKYSCRDTFAYVADVTEPALVVYDMRRNKSWRVVSNLLYPYPLHGSFDISDVKFDLMDGVFGLALGPLRNGDRTLFFHSLASVRESWVQTRFLRNESNFAGETNAVPKEFKVSEPRGTSQSAAEAMDINGVLFFSLLSENAIACWDSRLPYTPENIHIVAKDDTNLQFPSGMKVIGGELWVLTSRFQNVMVGKVPPNEINYRMLKAPIAELVRGTLCFVSSLDGDNLLGHVESLDAHRPPLLSHNAPPASYNPTASGTIGFPSTIGKPSEIFPTAWGGVLPHHYRPGNKHPSPSYGSFDERILFHDHLVRRKRRNSS